MARIIKFGSTELPPGFAPAGESIGIDLQPMKLPREHGARVLTAYQTEIVVPIRGRFIKGPIPILFGQNDMRGAIRSLHSLIRSGPQNLYFYDDSYLRNCQGQFSCSNEPHLFEKIVDVEIQFTSGDPFWYDGNETLDDWSSPAGTRVVTTGGNASAQPQYRFTTGSASINWTLTNNTTGKSLQIAGTSLTAGQVIVVDTLEKTVKIGTTDFMSLLIAGSEFFPLANGANTLQITTTLGTLSLLRTVYRNRWSG